MSLTNVYNFFFIHLSSQGAPIIIAILFILLKVVYDKTCPKDYTPMIVKEMTLIVHEYFWIPLNDFIFYITKQYPQYCKPLITLFSIIISRKPSLVILQQSYIIFDYLPRIIFYVYNLYLFVSHEPSNYYILSILVIPMLYNSYLKLTLIYVNNTKPENLDDFILVAKIQEEIRSVKRNQRNNVPIACFHLSFWGPLAIPLYFLVILFFVRLASVF